MHGVCECGERVMQQKKRKQKNTTCVCFCGGAEERPGETHCPPLLRVYGGDCAVIRRMHRVGWRKKWHCTTARVQRQ